MKTNGHIPGADGLPPSAPATAVSTQHRQQTQDTTLKPVSVQMARWMPVMDIDSAIARRQAIVDAMAHLMVEGVDYGKIPGTERPTLMQPGAHKLCIVFGITIKYEYEVQIEDWTGEDHGGIPFFYYRIRGKAYRDGEFLGEGVGSCNSWESKYRYRNKARVCPVCDKPTLRKSNRDGEEGWYCWKNPERGSDGCGAKFAPKHPEVINQIVGKTENPDIADSVNTVLKMAAKRCLVGTTLNATGASEFFTQDQEDNVDDSAPEAPKVQAATNQPSTKPVAAAAAAPAPTTITPPWGLNPNRGEIKAAFHALRSRTSAFDLDNVLAAYGIRTVDGFRTIEDAAKAYCALAQIAEKKVA